MMRRHRFPLASCTPGHRARGLSLIELLVAMAVGLILVTGLVSLFANSSQTGNELEKSIRQLESGRYGLELLNEDLSVAGYYGEVAMQGVSLKTAAPCTTTLSDLGWKNPTLIPPTPFEAPVPVTGLSSSEAAALPCLSGANHKADTPALVVRRVDTDMLPPTVATTGGVYLQTSRCSSDPVETRFLLGNTTSTFTLRAQNCTATNAVQRYISRVYFVATCNECGIDTVPTLKRAELGTNTMVVSPLAEGVDDIGFDFGFDTDGNGSPDVYRTGLSGTAGAADNNWANVVGVRIHLLSRATERTPGFVDPKTYVLGLSGNRGPFSDNFKRRAYTVTSRLHNIAGPRETPSP